MKDFDSIYKKYQIAFRELENHQLKYLKNDANNQMEESERAKNFEEHKNLMAKYQKAYSIFEKEFYNNIENQKLSLENSVIEILETTIIKNDWEKFFIVKDLIPYENQSAKLIETISWSILEILEREHLDFYIESGKTGWSKGAMLEYLVDNLNFKNNQFQVITPLKKVLLTVDEDDIDYYRLINLSISIMGYINTSETREVLIKKRNQSKDEYLINKINSILQS